MENNDRKAEIVPVLGIDTSTPDLVVKDGCCSKLHNFRHTADGWRTVPPFRHVVNIYNSDQYKVIYKHPASAENRFIAVTETVATTSTFTATSTLCEVYYAQQGNTIRFVQSQLLLSLPTTKYEVTHFGNVLIVRTEPEGEVYYFTLFKSVYRQSGVPAPVSLSYTLEKAVMPWNFCGTQRGTFRDPALFEFIASSPFIEKENAVSLSHRVFNITSGETLLPVNDGNNNCWYGEIALFVVFRMVDGTSLSPSMPMIIDALNEAGWSTYVEVAKDRIGGTADIFFELCVTDFGQRSAATMQTQPVAGRLCTRVKPTLKIKLNNASIDTTLIDRVTVYSTRINSPFDYGAIGAGRLNDHVQWLKASSSRNVRRIAATEVYGDNQALMKQPFYFLRDIKLDEFRNGEYNLVLGYDVLKDIEQNRVYEPNQSLHRMTGRIFHDYNSRLHIADISTKFYEGYPLDDVLEVTRAVDSNTWGVITLEANNKTYYIKQKSDGQANKYRQPTYGREYLRILAYPDSRAKEWHIYSEAKSGGTVLFQDKRLFEPAPAIDMAFHIPPVTNYRKYPLIELFVPQANVSTIPEDNGHRESNRLQVSALNNPFSLPFELSYSIGTENSTIFAMNTIADQLSDSKFGEFPLYVFTDNGIWALQTGSGEIVYSNVVPINHDRLINTNTVAAAYNVFYITSRGLFAIKAKYATLLSQPLNDRNNNPPLDYLKGAKLHYQHLHNEIIVHNPQYTYAYVYAIDGGSWSTRDFPGAKLNNDLVVGSHNALSNFEEEVLVGNTTCSLTTRPLKFGSAEYKRLETLIPRLQWPNSPQQLQIKIEGSNDLRVWDVLRDETLMAQEDVTIRRTPQSKKYFRVTLFVTVADPVALNHFHIELYNRFLHRLR